MNLFVWERPSALTPLFYPNWGALRMHRRYKNAWPRTYCRFSGGMVRWMNDMKEMIENGRWFVEELLNKEYHDMMMADYRQLSSALSKEFEMIQDLSHVTDDELSDTFSAFDRAYLDWWSLAMIAELISYGCNDMLDLEPEKIRLLTSPSEPSFSQQEEIELMKLLKADKDIEKLLENHSKKYFWMHNNYHDTEYLGPEYFRKRIEEHLEAGTDPDKFISEVKASAEAIKAKKLRLSEGLDDRTRKILAIGEEFVAFQDNRKMINMQADHYLDVLLCEIGRRIDVSTYDMKFSLPEECKAAISTKEIDTMLLHKRQDLCMMIVDRQGYRFLYGKEAQEKEKELRETGDDKIAGISANKGRYKGRARVILNPRKPGNFQEGDILITTMTTPDFVPLLRKAGAIVTDEGGITCHAAIISRELGIPCVIATRNATLKIDDSETIEVDANSGVVNKL